ncbi:Tfp pilus assembly protein FimT/FimU [Patescibacteria group bacterium]
MWHFKKGLSLVETILIIAISLTLLVIVTSGFKSLRNSQILTSGSEEIVSLINEARSKTLSSEQASQYGVHFELNRAVLFKGDTFVEPSADNKELIYSGFIEMSSISLNGGGSDLVFERLTGETAQNGMVTINLTNDLSKIREITIEPSGTISVEIY